MKNSRGVNNNVSFHTIHDQDFLHTISSVRRVFLHFRASFPPLSFLDAYYMSRSSLRYKTLSIVIILLVLWSICLSSFLVNLKNDPEYHTRWTSQVFILLMRFLLASLVSRKILLLLLSYLFDGVCIHFSKVRHFPSLQEFWYFPELANLPVYFFLADLHSPVGYMHLFKPIATNGMSKKVI